MAVYPTNNTQLVNRYAAGESNTNTHTPKHILTHIHTNSLNPSFLFRLGQLLDIDMDTVFTMNNVDEDSTKKHPFPCPTTYR